MKMPQTSPETFAWEKTFRCLGRFLSGLQIRNKPMHASRPVSGWHRAILWSAIGTAGVLIGTAQALAQSNVNPPTDPLGVVYARLDEQLALGQGRIGAIPREVEKPKVVTDEAEDGRYVPRTRDDFRRHQNELRDRNIEAMNAANRARNEAYFNQLREQCGTQPLTGAKIGMAQQWFEQCGQEIRFGGGLTHLISLHVQGHDARLYVFRLGKVHKVYAVDQRITRIDPRPPESWQASLPEVGTYPPNVRHPLVVALSQGQFFAYGEANAEDWLKPAGAQLQAWSEIIPRSYTSETPPPLMWDTTHKGWVKLPKPPACSGLWHQHTLTALADDRVLVAGGMCDIPRLLNEPGIFEPQLRTALWDARSGTWLEAPSLRQARIHHTATLLNGNQVMLVGGFDDPITAGGIHALNTVELFAGGSWHDLSSLNTARAKHSATVLPNGGVLVVGGTDNKQRAMAQVELWDGAQQRWLLRAPMHTARYGHAATLLEDGRVLVTGGIDVHERVLNTTELYDPATDTWVDAPPLPEHLQGHASIRLSNGRVLLAAGQVNPPTRGPWLFTWHPNDPAWRAEGIRALDIPSQHRHRPTLVQITPGQILAFGARAVFLYPIPGVDQKGMELPNFPSEWWKEPPPTPVVTPTPAPAAVGQPSFLTRLAYDLWNARTHLALLTAGLLLLWYLARQWRVRRANAHDHVEPRRTRWLSWIVRLMVYGGLLLVLLPHIVAYLKLRSRDMEDECMVRATACLDKGTGLLARQWAVPGRSKWASPRVPCAFVGEWHTQRGSIDYHIQLLDDGTYSMPGSQRNLPEEKGYWAVQGKYMIWRSTTHSMGEMDINRIVSNDGRHIELIETNGLHSHFDYQADLPRLRCER